MREVISAHSLVRGVVLNDPAVTNQKYDSGHYQFIIETEFGFANVGVYQRRDYWEVISSTSGYSKDIPVNTQLLASSFHQNIAAGIKRKCEKAASN